MAAVLVVAQVEKRTLIDPYADPNLGDMKRYEVVDRFRFFLNLQDIMVERSNR